MKRSILILLAIAFCSCAQNYKMESARSTTDETLASDQSNVPSSQEAHTDPNAKLIRTADYRFRVDDMKKSSDAIEMHVRKFPAHISSSNMSFVADIMQTTMTIRVRSEFFNDLLREIDKEAGHVHYRNIRTEDVAKQFVDLESRLKTKREVQERYKEILRTKAGKIEELLAAEKQIGELQEEIKAAVSRLNFLKDQVSYSTINLEFYQRIEDQNLAAEDQENIAKKFGNAFFSGLKGTIAVLIAATNLWPIIVVCVLAVFYFRKKRLLSFPQKRTNG
jgi:hypothetical protein